MIERIDGLTDGVLGFGWMTPGELKVFAAGERDAAVDWLAR